jgi:hypothetical protein
VDRKRVLGAVAAASLLAAFCAALLPHLWLLAAICGVLAACDLLYQRLPLPFQIAALVVAFACGADGITMGMVMGSVGFLSLGSSSGGWGDAIMMGLLGLWFGWLGLAVVFAGSLVPVLRIAAGRADPNELQPLAGWWLLAALAAAPFLHIVI